jgi:electron transfer flavoprotein alpha subunit
MTSNVLVFIEQRDGKCLPGAIQAITAAAQLAGKLGGQVSAGLIGAGLDVAAQAVEKLPIASLYLCESPVLAHYDALKYARALAAIIEQADPRIVLFAASSMGRDLAPRAAARLDAGLATDCVELEIDGGALSVRRPIYNGKATCKVHFNPARLQMASIRANTFAAPVAGAVAAPRISVRFEGSPEDDRQSTREVVRTGGAEKDVTEASIVVSGGRSLKNEENFKIIYDLAHALDGAVGASRAACDAGYQPHSRQVGLTGKTVTPSLYIACGISGAIQHLAGMRGSRCIVAINTDAEAPIFKVADYGVVADLFSFVPLLTEEVKKARGH